MLEKRFRLRVTKVLKHVSVRMACGKTTRHYVVALVVHV